MGRRYDTVSFLSDLGTEDEAAGVVRAVLRELAPHATVVDLTHGIAPFDVRAGALALVRAIAYVPEGVVMAVVDPGGGTARRAVAVEVGGGSGVLLGPDNGLLAPAVALAGGAERAVVLDDVSVHLEAPGLTFAARDIFAPVAARLCLGDDLSELGTEIDPALLLPSVIPLPRSEGEVIVTEVLWVDRFGNAQLNVGPDELAEVWGPQWTEPGLARISVVLDDDRRTATVVRGFGDLPTGALGLVVDSLGMYSIAMDRASAAAALRIGTTDQVRLQQMGLEASRTEPSVTSVSLGPTRTAPDERR